MESPNDYARTIQSVTFDRDLGLATVQFACTEDEIGDMIPGNSVCMCAWVTVGSDGFDLKVTSDDRRLDRQDVRSRILRAYNAEFQRRHQVERSLFIVDPSCMEMPR